MREGSVLGPEHDAKEVRSQPKVAASRAVAHRFESHRRKLPERGRRRRDDRRSGGCHQFRLCVHTRQQGTPEQREDRGARAGDRPVARGDHAARVRHRGAHDVLDPERVEQREGADDIDKRVAPPGLVGHADGIRFLSCARGRPALSRSTTLGLAPGAGDMMFDGVIPLGKALRPLCL